MRRESVLVASVQGEDVTGGLCARLRGPNDCLNANGCK